MNSFFFEIAFTGLILGWTISLSPNLVYDVYLSAPGVSFPTYSSKINLPYFTLQHRSQTFINFVAEKYIKIRRKGLLVNKRFCNEQSHYHETADCEKQCFLDSNNVGHSFLFLFKQKS